jgi:flagellar basal body rod protein FlgC
MSTLSAAIKASGSALSAERARIEVAVSNLSKRRLHALGGRAALPPARRDPCPDQVLRSTPPSERLRRPA